MTQLYLVPETYVRSAYKPLKPTLRRLQLDLVFDLMSDGKWRTLAEIGKRIKAPTQSVSARLRDLRKKQYGGHLVERMGSDKKGVYLYRLVLED